MGGGPSSQTSTSHTGSHLPKWEQPYAKHLLKEAGSMYGGQLPQQNVAPFTADQLAAQHMTEQLSGPESQFLQGAQGQNAATSSGQYLDPSTNNYLQSYYDAAAAPMMANYKDTVAPNLPSNAVTSGGLGSSGTQQAFGQAETNLSSGLENLAANIYEPAYMAERQLQQGATQFAPNMAQAQYLPGQELGNVGQSQQQQQQNVLNTAYQNLMAPYNALGTQGNLLNSLSGGGSNSSTISVSPNAGATGK